MKKGLYELAPIPRLTRGIPAVRSIGWMPDHLYLHRNRWIEAPHLCFTLRAELGAVKTLVNGRLRERRIRAPYVGLVRHGQVYHTVQAVRHDELYFVYEPAMYGELQRQTLLVSLKEVYGYAVLAGIVFLLGVMAMRYRRIVRYVRVPPVEVFKRLLEIRMLTKAKS